jgi:hypothetical protein
LLALEHLHWNGTNCVVIVAAGSYFQLQKRYTYIRRPFGSEQTYSVESTNGLRASVSALLTMKMKTTTTTQGFFSWWLSSSFFLDRSPEGIEPEDGFQILTIEWNQVYSPNNEIRKFAGEIKFLAIYLYIKAPQSLQRLRARRASYFPPPT